MLLDMTLLSEGNQYSRSQLSDIWGLGGPEALRRGIVTPAENDDILLFITEKKSASQTSYEDALVGNELIIESDGQAHSERKMEALLSGVGAAYLFYRERSAEPFTYYGEVILRQLLPRTQSGRARYRLTVGGDSDALATVTETDDAIATELLGQEEGHAQEGGRRFSRSGANRQAAIEAHGDKCVVCDFSFDDNYGSDLADGYIQVHHLVSIAGGVRTPDPRTELVPVCANCHAMLHRRRNHIVSIAELRARIAVHKFAGASVEQEEVSANSSGSV